MNAAEIEQLTSLSGKPLEVILIEKGGKPVTFKLAPLVPMDWVEARNAIVADRQRRFIEATANSLLDPTTKAKALAEISTSPISRADLLTDTEASMRLLELSAKRGGFGGSWQGFMGALGDTDVVELQNKLLVVCGYRNVESNGKGDKVPLDHATNTT